MLEERVGYMRLGRDGYIWHLTTRSIHRVAISTNLRKDNASGLYEGWRRRWRSRKRKRKRRSQLPQIGSEMATTWMELEAEMEMEIVACDRWASG